MDRIIPPLNKMQHFESLRHDRPLSIICILFFVWTMLIPFVSPGQSFKQVDNKDIFPADIKTGAERTDVYFPWIKGKNIAVVTNYTATIGKTHLVDSLLRAGMKIKKVFCPEHGFRGDAEAGAIIKSGIDQKTGLPVISIYGSVYKPKAEDLKDVDVVIFDIQDVGVRFYTYISTLHYVMEACAENQKALIVLDRPNPNGFYVDGPLLKPAFTSFVGVDPIPIVHGLTVAEYACMANGEGWLKDSLKCSLKTVQVSHYDHTCHYHLPIKPSPNLPNMNAIWLYPSLCLFEGTVVSLGRGTDKPFQQYGHPLLKNTNISFTPHSIPGMAANPQLQDTLCYGYDLQEFSESYIKNSGQLYLFWLTDAYAQLKSLPYFFKPGFDRLAGTDELRKQIMAGMSEEDIRKSWENDLATYKKIRKKYLLYPDFE